MSRLGQKLWTEVIKEITVKLSPFRAVLIAAFLTALCACSGDRSESPHTRPPHISGEWILLIQGPGGSTRPAEYRVTFRSSGAKLAGSMSSTISRKSASFAIDGAVSGTNVAFLVKAGGFEIGPFEGAVNDKADSMQGTLKESPTNPQRNWKAYKLR